MLLPLGNIVKKIHINVCRYADDTKFYLTMKQNETNQLTKLQEYGYYALVLTLQTLCNDVAVWYATW